MLREKLKQEMVNRGFSPRDLAKEIGTSHTTILRTLRGDDVDMKTILKYSAWLGVKPATLINSLPPDRSALPEKIIVMLGNHPILEKEFSRAVDAIVENKIDPSIIEDIAAYAAYKINMGLLQQKRMKSQK